MLNGIAILISVWHVVLVVVEGRERLAVFTEGAQQPIRAQLEPNRTTTKTAAAAEPPSSTSSLHQPAIAAYSLPSHSRSLHALTALAAFQFVTVKFWRFSHCDKMLARSVIRAVPTRGIARQTFGKTSTVRKPRRSIPNSLSETGQSVAERL